MAFQDFGHLSERRKAERQQKLRKRITIGAVSSLVVLLVAGCAVFAVVSRSNHAAREDEAVNATKQLSESSKAVKMVCAPTDYKKTCETSLSKAVGSSPRPKDLVKAAISVIMDEVGRAFNHSTKFKPNDPKVRDAIHDCKELLGYAMDDLETTFSSVHGHSIEHLPDRAHDLKTWLSASITYQETCIDGFPEGKFKSKMREVLTTAKELSSNALAIVNEVSSLFRMLQIPAFDRRRLLEEKSGEEEEFVKGGVPAWMTHEDRRVLKEHSKADLKPDVVVAKDGSGNYKTINEAIANLPKDRKGRYVIYIKAGVYDETVIVEKDMVNITMYGDGSRKTIITGNKNFIDGIGTYKTATFAAIGDGFIAKAIGFRNTAGAIKHQAVALRVQSDRSIFLSCRMEGYQDTLYAQTHRQFYRGCVICGTIDFIFGDAAAVFQNCVIVVRKPLDNQQNIVTAHGRTDRHETTGIVIQNCRIVPDKKLKPVKGTVRSYLGRPWKEYARTIIMESTIDSLIHPDGWLEWDGDFALKTLLYGEYNNKGPGAGLTTRVKWPGYKVLKKEDASKYTVGSFIQGSDWIKTTGTPVHLGLYYA